MNNQPHNNPMNQRKRRPAGKSPDQAADSMLIHWWLKNKDLVIPPGQ